MDNGIASGGCHATSGNVADARQPANPLPASVIRGPVFSEFGGKVKNLVVMTCIWVASLALAGCSRAPSTLADWEKQAFRPGFVLLDSDDTGDYFIAVFDTGVDEIAFCYFRKAQNPQSSSSSLRIADDSGLDLHDLSRSPKTDLSWTEAYGIATYSGRDGIVYQIREGYSGAINIRFTVSDGASPHKTIYDKRLIIPKPHDAESGGPARGSQPVHSETSRTTSAAGSRG